MVNERGNCVYEVLTGSLLSAIFLGHKKNYLVASLTPLGNMENEEKDVLYNSATILESSRGNSTQITVQEIITFSSFVKVATI